jgi:hypothetical protein
MANIAAEYERNSDGIRMPTGLLGPVVARKAGRFPE